MNNGGNPAMPVNEGTAYRIIHHSEDGYAALSAGLTKREELAARAMQGLLSAGALQDDCTFEEIAETCVTQADALLAELEKPQ